MSIERELAEGISQALGRAGMTGAVTVAGGLASLDTMAGRVTISVTRELANWPRLDPEARQQLARKVVMRLAAERRNQGKARSGSGGSWLSWLSSWTSLALVALAVVVGGLVYLGGEDPAALRKIDAPEVKESSEQQREGRAKRVCDVTRTRVMRGTPVGPADVEGWVAEVGVVKLGAKAPLLAEPKLKDYFANVKAESRTRLVWPGAPDLTELRSISTAVILGSIRHQSTDHLTKVEGMRATFSGRYVARYFGSVAQRKGFIALGRELRATTLADYGAVYARCAHRPAILLGSSFMGETPTGALVALLYFHGAYAESPLLRRSALAPEVRKRGVDHAHLIEALRTAVGKRSAVEVAAMLSPHLGTLQETPEHGAAITFALDDPNRAARASRVIARKLGIAAEH